MTPQSKILQEKTKEIEEIGNIMRQYNVVGLASLQKVRAAQLQTLRKKLRSSTHLRVIKKTLVKRAIEQAKNKPNLAKLESYLTGPTIYLFTNLNPFKLVLLLEKSKVKTTAKTGDIAAFDVVVPAGNTGQPPGPIISQLGAVGLKTRIESGSVWINKDTLVVKKGEVIPERLAAVLSKLGIKPVEGGLVLKAVYDNGTIIAEELLQVNAEKTRRAFGDAYNIAFHLSVRSGYTTPENIGFLLRKAHDDAYRLSVNEGVPTKETVAELLVKAYVHMTRLKTALNSFHAQSQKS